MSTQDVRWIQRYHNYKKALGQVEEAVSLARQRPLSKLEEQGLIQAFEFTHELAWKTMKDFLENRGVLNLYGSKDVTRNAFQTGLISNGEVWMAMIQSRSLTSHAYDDTVVTKIISAIIKEYYGEFESLHVKLEELKRDELS